MSDNDTVSDNTVSRNNMTNNSYGVCLYWSSENAIYHTNFVNNIPQVYVTPGYADFGMMATLLDETIGAIMPA